MSNTALIFLNLDEEALTVHHFGGQSEQYALRGKEKLAATSVVMSQSDHVPYFSSPLSSKFPVPLVSPSISLQMC